MNHCDQEDVGFGFDFFLLVLTTKKVVGIHLLLGLGDGDWLQVDVAVAQLLPPLPVKVTHVPWQRNYSTELFGQLDQVGVPISSILKCCMLTLNKREITNQ